MNIEKAVLALFLPFQSICSSHHQIHSETPVYINGIVLDATTSQPIKNAIIELGNVPTKLGEWQQVENRTLDNNDFFCFRFRVGKSYCILVYYSGSKTPRFDYASSRR